MLQLHGFALITGASSGIGEALSIKFAANKIPVLLIARTTNKLEQLASKLKNEYKIEALIFSADLSKPNEAYRILEFCETQQIPIQYLVNNAGFGDFGEFATGDIKKTEEMITVNITVLTQLTRLFLPQMLARKSGKIMQVASTAAFQPGPLMAVYYATKAYVLHFSEALSNELENTGITVTALCPGATTSNFQQAADMENSKLVKGKRLPSSAQVANYGFKAMMNGKVVAVHGLNNYLLALSVRLAPRSWVVKLVRFIQNKT